MVTNVTIIGGLRLPQRTLGFQVKFLHDCSAMSRGYHRREAAAGDRDGEGLVRARALWRRLAEDMDARLQLRVRIFADVERSGSLSFADRESAYCGADRPG